MTVQRLTTIKEQEILRNSKKFKNRRIKDLSQEEKDDLLELIAKKLGLL